MLKVISFDCDGVMFDSINLNKEYYNYILGKLGYAPMTPEELEYVHAQNVTASIAHIFRNYPDQSMAEVDKIRQETDYNSFLKYMSIEPELHPFLEAIHGKYKLAISTNRSNTMDDLLRDYDLGKYFGKVMTAVTSKRPKPAPDGLLEILEHYQCSASEAVHIGDTFVDEEHAAAAGVQLIAFRNKRLNTPYHVDNFMEILDLDLLKSKA